MPEPNGDRYLTAAEVAPLFKVAVKTVGNWARTGKLPHSRTLGGHRRYRESEMVALAARQVEPGQQANP